MHLCLLAFIFSNENLAVNLIGVPLYINSHFSFAAFYFSIFGFDHFYYDVPGCQSLFYSNGIC